MIKKSGLSIVKTEMKKDLPLGDLANDSTIRERSTMTAMELLAAISLEMKKGSSQEYVLWRLVNSQSPLLVFCKRMEAKGIYLCR